MHDNTAQCIEHKAFLGKDQVLHQMGSQQVEVILASDWKVQS